VAHLAQTVIVVEAPGMGDDVQAIKAGIIEIADILVVNKADRPDVNQTVSALQAALDLAPQSGGHHGAGGLASAVASSHVLDGDVWTVPVLKTVAMRGEGIGALIDKIVAHRDWLLSTGQVERRRLRRSREEVTARLRELLLRRALRALDSDEFEFLVRGVADGRMTASDAARTIAARFVDGS
jgi:LAO/AO transport system kinase